MSEAEPKKKRVWDLIFFILIPSLINVCIVIVYWFVRIDPPQSFWPTYCAGIASFLAVIVTFLPAFNETIADRFAFFWLLLNGIFMILAFALIHNAFSNSLGGDNETSINACRMFRDCLYFSIVTFTTLGYGDFQPAPELRLLAAGQAMMGYVFLGFIVAIANDWMRATTKKAAQPWDFPKFWNTERSAG